MSSNVSLGRAGNDGFLKGYFCSEVVFNLSQRVLSDLKIEVLDKELGFLLHHHLLIKQIFKEILPIFRKK